MANVEISRFGVDQIVPCYGNGHLQPDGHLNRNAWDDTIPLPLSEKKKNIVCYL